MSEFAIGLFLIAIAVTGNAQPFGKFAIDNAFSFVKWAIAIWILEWCITKAPKDALPATRVFGGGLILGIILLNQNKITALIKQAAQEFQTGAATDSTASSNAYANKDNGLLSGASGSNSTASPDNGLLPGTTWNNSNSQGSNMATLAQQQAFIQNNMPYAEQVANQLGTSPATVLAQSAYETGWGTSSAYNNDNNVAGINNPGSQTGEDYAQYNTLAAGWQGYQNLMQDPRYQYTYGLTGTMFAQAANNAGYSTNPNYASEYSGVYNSVLNLTGASS